MFGGESCRIKPRDSIERRAHLAGVSCLGTVGLVIQVPYWARF